MIRWPSWRRSSIKWSCWLRTCDGNWVDIEELHMGSQRTEATTVASTALAE